jgi:hypothetical protein
VRPSRRRLVAAYLLGNYVFLLAGIPLPLPADKDVSRPFPCQHHQCGCANADQCWRGCCCYSHAEKLAWARAHEVHLPAELLAESQANSDERKSCCRTSNDDVRLAHAEPQKREESACCSHQSDQAPPAERESHHDGLIGIRALECQGGSAAWLLLAAATPPTAEIAFAPDFAARELVPTADSFLHGLLWAPDPPPPRA